MKWQLAKTGKFKASTGDITITREMLEEIAANSPGDIPLKVSHNVPYPGEGAIGWIDGSSLEVRDEGEEGVLLGLVSLNKDGAYLVMEAEIYRNWSIEANKWMRSDGKWTLTGLAMLGAEPPAIPGLKQVAASSGDNGKTTVFFSNKNLDLLTENEVMELKLAEKLKETELQLSMAQKSHDTEKADLEKTIEEMRAKNEELEKRIAEYEKSSFEASLGQLEATMKGKAPSEHVKELVADYKKEGIACSADVARQVKYWAKAPEMVSFSENAEVKAAMKAIKEKEANEAKELEKKNEAIKASINPKGM